jgi:hypothetical protein
VEQGTCLQGTAEQHSWHLNSTTPQQPDNAAAVHDETRPVPRDLLAVREGMITECVPLAFAGNMFNQQLLAMIGVSLSAKDVVGRFLDEICME